MIHGGLGGVFADCFPLAATDTEGEGDRRRFGVLTVVADSVVVVRVIGSTGEVNLAFFLGSPGGNAIAGAAGMRRELGPFNLGNVAFGDLAHPAFAGRDVPWAGAAGVL